MNLSEIFIRRPVMTSLLMIAILLFCFLDDPAPAVIYTLSLHDALPICFAWSTPQRQKLKFLPLRRYNLTLNLLSRSHDRSEERFSRNAETDLVCRLLLEKKNV